MPLKNGYKVRRWNEMSDKVNGKFGMDERAKGEELKKEAKLFERAMKLKNRVCEEGV